MDIGKKIGESHSDVMCNEDFEIDEWQDLKEWNKKSRFLWELKNNTDR